MDGVNKDARLKRVVPRDTAGQVGDTLALVQSIILRTLQVTTSILIPLQRWEVTKDKHFVTGLKQFFQVSALYLCISFSDDLTFASYVRTQISVRSTCNS